MPFGRARRSGNPVRLYDFEAAKKMPLGKPGKLAEAKAKYAEAGPERSNLRYGYIAKPV
jgi:hypothetical protein